MADLGGKMKEMAGKAEAALGKKTGNTEMESEGHEKAMEGAFDQAAEHARETVENTKDGLTPDHH